MLQEKFKYLCNQVEVSSKIKHVVTTYTSYGIKISTFSSFLEKKSGDEAEVVQCPFNCYIHVYETAILGLNSQNCRYKTEMFTWMASCEISHGNQGQVFCFVLFPWNDRICNALSVYDIASSTKLFTVNLANGCIFTANIWTLLLF